MGPNRTNLLNQGLPRELGDYSVYEWRQWLEPLVEGDSQLDGHPKSEWSAWLDDMERQWQEQQELQEARQIPEVAGPMAAASSNGR